MSDNAVEMSQSKPNAESADRSGVSSKHEQWGRLGRSVLNGVIGDYLERQNNPLAIKMAFYHHFKPIVLNNDLAHQLDFPLTNKVVVLVHGLTNLETVWDFHRPENPAKSEASQAFQLDEYVDSYIESYFNYAGGRPRENYGTKLQEEFGFTPFYLRYNTGLTLEKNARELSALLTKLFNTYPIQIDQLVLIGFSMGGLLTRYAQALAMESLVVPEWREKLTECIYIGTPHEGSPLEKFGHLAGEVLRHIPKEYVSHWADWVDIRSEGIQDLKDGLRYLNKDRSKEEPVCHSFTEHAQHYFISGAVSKKNSLLNKLVGDSLVRQSSAKPSSAPLTSHTAHFEGMVHMHLANSKRVYQQIKSWLMQDAAADPSLSIPLKTYTIVRKPYTEKNQHDISTQELVAASIELLASAYEKTLETVETMHYAIADEPFSVLQKLPVISQVADPIEATHKQILDSVYKILRMSGKWVHSSAKKLAAEAVKTAKSAN